MSVNINSISDCYNAWRDYKYGENTRGITPEEFRDIENRWSANLVSWKSQATQDENQYEISDDDKQSAHDQGVQDAKDTTGHDGSSDTAKSWGTTIGTSVVGTGAVAVTGALTGKYIIGAAKRMEDGASKAKASANAIWNTILIAGIGGALYGMGRLVRASDPNGDQAEALQTLNEELLPEAQEELGNAQSEMLDASETVANLTEEANEQNEETNENIEENKTEFDMYRELIEILQAKVESGEQLSESEKELYQELAPLLEELGAGITEMSEDNTDNVAAIYDEIGEYQGTFDDSVETIEQVQGLTDYAADFDEQTLKNTGVVQEGANIGGMASQGVQAGGAAGIYAGVTKMHSVFSFWAGVAQIAAGSSAVLTGGLAKNQFDTLKKEQENYGEIATNEIANRVQTQEFDAQSLEVYSEQIESYADNISIVEDLEMAIPDDLDVPDNVPISSEDSAATQNGTTEDGIYGQGGSYNADIDKDKNGIA